MAHSELAARIAAGDATALNQFYREYRGRILAVARPMVRDEWDAEEVLQDVVWTVHRKIDSFRGDSDFWYWVRRITQNAARMLLRKRRRVPTPIEDKDIQARMDAEPTEVNTTRTESVTLARFAAIRMDEALRSQDPVNQQLFQMMDVEGRDKEEVARLLDLSIPALKARLHRVRKSLRKAAAQDLAYAHLAI